MDVIKSREEAQGEIDQLKEWADKQPQLPKDIDDRFLHRFLHSCYYDLEKTKLAVELFYTLRASMPEIVNNRDPMSDQVQKTLKIVNLALLSTPAKRNIWIWQLNDPGLEKYDYVQDTRLFFLATDAWIMSNDNMEESDVAILDVKDLSLKYITKFNVSVARKLSKYQEEAMPIRLKQVHVVNAPPFIDKLFALLKPFMKNDIQQVIHMHPPKSDTIFKFFSREELPEDFGGTRGKMQDHMKDVLKMIMDNREQFLNDDLWKAIDTKKAKGKAEVASTDVGSFRSLDID